MTTESSDGSCSCSGFATKLRQRVPAVGAVVDRAGPIVQSAARSDEAKRVRTSFVELCCALWACMLALLRGTFKIAEEALNLPSDGNLKTRAAALVHTTAKKGQSAFESRERSAAGTEATAFCVARSLAGAATTVAKVGVSSARAYQGPGKQYVESAVSTVDDFVEAVKNAPEPAPASVTEGIDETPVNGQQSGEQAGEDDTVIEAAEAVVEPSPADKAIES